MSETDTPAEWIDDVGNARLQGRLRADLSHVFNGGTITDPLTLDPTDQTVDSPFINMLYSDDLVNQSNFGYVINVRPEGSEPGDNDELFSVSVLEIIFRSAPGEGNARFSLMDPDNPARQVTLSSSNGIQAIANATDNVQLLKLSSEDTIGVFVKARSDGKLAFFDKAATDALTEQPVVPLTAPSVQDVIDALVQLGLVAQHD